MTVESKKTLCIDFDGVLHSYTSGWQGAVNVPDEPVAGAMKFIWDATQHFRVCIFSSRSNQPGGIRAMQDWLRKHFMEYWGTHAVQADDKLAEIEWPTEKPPAFVSIDDRAITFTGVFPSISELKGFKPWNKHEEADLAARHVLLAAPDLLAACKALVELYDIRTQVICDGLDDVINYDASVLVLAAIAKAEGRA
jgi:hypothetical protein